MTSLWLPSHSQPPLSIFPYFGVDLSLHSKHPSSNPAFSALHSIRIDRPSARTLMLGLAALLPAALSPGDMELAVADAHPGSGWKGLSSISPHLKGARTPPANAFSPYPIQAEQHPSPPKLNPFSPSGPRSILGSLAFKNQIELLIHRCLVPSLPF